MVITSEIVCSTSFVCRAVPAADVELFRFIAQITLQKRHEADHDINGTLKHVLVEHLGTDVAVQAPQFQAAAVQRETAKRESLTGFDRPAEFDVDSSGVHCLVAVRIDAGRHAQQDLLSDAAAGRFMLKPQKAKG